MTFLTIGTQISILFVLLALGYCLRRLGVLTDAGIGELTKVLCYIVSPCLIFMTFQRPFSSALMQAFLVAAGSAVTIHAIAIAFSAAVFNKKTVTDPGKRDVSRFATVYSNCGFMGFPLLQAVAGSTGVLLGAAYVAVYNLYNWSHGIAIFTGKTSRKAILSVLLNPNILALAIGVPLFCLSITLPAAVRDGLSYVAEMNTGLSMIVVGSQFTKVNLASLFNEGLVWLIAFLRNLVMPLLLLALLWVVGLRGILLLGCVLPVACPVASNTVIFATLVGKNTEFSVKTVALSTLICIVTIPIILFIIKCLV